MSFSQLNIEAFRTINNLGKQYPYLNDSFVFLAEYTVYIFALIVLIRWFSRNQKDRIMIICASLSFVMSEILGKLAGVLHSNKQPFAVLPDVNQLIEKAVDNSFPSDHTILFFSFCITFAIFHKKTGFIWILLACLVGFSRIWVGVHYPADVIAGAMISTLTAFLIYATLAKSKFVLYMLTIYDNLEQLIVPSSRKSKNY